MEVWADYFKSFLNQTNENDNATATPNIPKSREEEENTGLPIPEKFDFAIVNLNNNKASGVDNIPGDLLLLKVGLNLLKDKIYDLISKIWDVE